MPQYNEICQYAPGRPITLSVDGGGAGTHSRTKVVVTGTGHSPERQDDLAEAVDRLEEWPSNVSTHLICLNLAVIEGNTMFDDES